MDIKNRIFIFFCFVFTPVPSLANSLGDISSFAAEICDNIKSEGSISKKEVTEKLNMKLDGIAKLIGVSAASEKNIAVDNNESDFKYTGLPYESLPEQMIDARACKKDIAILLLRERKNISELKVQDDMKALSKLGVTKDNYRKASIGFMNTGFWDGLYLSYTKIKGRNFASRMIFNYFTGAQGFESNSMTGIGIDVLFGVGLLRSPVYAYVGVGLGVEYINYAYEEYSGLPDHSDYSLGRSTFLGLGTQFDDYALEFEFKGLYAPPIDNGWIAVNIIYRF